MLSARQVNLVGEDLSEQMDHLGLMALQALKVHRVNLGRLVHQVRLVLSVKMENEALLVQRERKERLVYQARQENAVPRGLRALREALVPEVFLETEENRGWLVQRVNQDVMAMTAK